MVETTEQSLSLDGDGLIKYAEVEIDDKVLAVTARNDAVPYSIYVIN